MWSLREADDVRLREFLLQQFGAPHSYPEVGDTRGSAEPAGYEIDHNAVQLGTGEAAFAAACDAIRQWKMFPAGWTRISPVDAPIETGQIVAMQAHALGFWWLNACRIVYVLDETTPVRRFGFAYGTLLDHVERGEERFSVELHADGALWYDIRAFSQPRYWPVRLAKPLARWLQRRFVADSMASMVAAVRAAVPESR